MFWGKVWDRINKIYRIGERGRLAKKEHKEHKEDVAKFLTGKQVAGKQTKFSDFLNYQIKEGS